MTYSTRDVSLATGATFRQIDYWERTGRLLCFGSRQGSGSRRRYSLSEVIVAAVMVRVMPLGFAITDEVVTALRDDPTCAYVTVAYDGAIKLTVDIDEIRSALAEAVAS